VHWLCTGSGLDVVEFDLLEIGDDVVFGSRSVVGCYDLPWTVLASDVLQLSAPTTS
jgi:hypothetical protein